MAGHLRWPKFPGIWVNRSAFCSTVPHGGGITEGRTQPSRHGGRREQTRGLRHRPGARDMRAPAFALSSRDRSAARRDVTESDAHGHFRHRPPRRIRAARPSRGPRARFSTRPAVSLGRGDPYRGHARAWRTSRPRTGRVAKFYFLRRRHLWHPSALARSDAKVDLEGIDGNQEQVGEREAFAWRDPNSQTARLCASEVGRRDEPTMAIAAFNI